MRLSRSCKVYRMCKAPYMGMQLQISFIIFKCYLLPVQATVHFVSGSILQQHVLEILIIFLRYAIHSWLLFEAQMNLFSNHE